MHGIVGTIPAVHGIYEPLDFIARLAALIPRPRVNLTRFHGVLAPNSRARAQVIAAARGKRRAKDHNRPEPEKHRAMTWAQRLKRVFMLDIDWCRRFAAKFVLYFFLCLCKERK